MSDLAEKLEQPVSTPAIAARAKYSQLKALWFCDETAKAAPELLSIRSATGSPQMWKRISGKSDDAVFERIQ